MIGNKRFSINIAAQMFSFLINMGVGFFLTPYIVRNVGNDAYGFIGLAINFTSYAQLITIALNSMVSRNITISIHSNDLISANKYFTSVFYGNIILSAFMSLVFLFTIIYLEEIINIPRHLILDIKLLFSLISFNFLFSLITSVFGVCFFVKNRLDLASLRSIFSNIIKVGILFFCFSFFHSSVWYIGLSTLMTTIYLSYTSFKISHQILPELKISRFYFDIQKIKELLNSGIWTALTKLGGILNVGLDLLLANLFISSSAMGTLSLAKTIPSIILSVFGTLAAVYSPNLTIAFASNNSMGIVKQLFSSIKFFGFISSIPLVILFAYGDIFFKLWMPGENYYLIYVLSIFTCIELCFALPLEALWNVFIATNKVKTSSICFFITCLMTFTSVYIAMHFVEINYRIYFLGGITSLYGVLRSITFLPIYGAKCLNMNWRTFYPILIKNLISVMILTFISLLMRLCFNPDSWLSLLCIALATCLFILFFNFYVILTKYERKIYFDFLIIKISSLSFK